MTKANGKVVARRVEPWAAGGREAKRLAAVILEVLAGARTPRQAAQAVSVSLPRYYQLETRAMTGLVAACEPRQKGRQRGPRNLVASLQKENDRLRQDLTRQQTLVRLAQRTVGLSAPLPVKNQRRQRKPTARALATAARLRNSADASSETTKVET